MAFNRFKACKGLAPMPEKTQPQGPFGRSGFDDGIELRID
mgnify:CR=1 FL=1